MNTVFLNTSTMSNHHAEMDGTPRRGQRLFYDGKWWTIVRVEWRPRDKDTLYQAHLHMRRFKVEPVKVPE